MKRYVESMLNWIFPAICCVCGDLLVGNTDLCDICKLNLPWAVDRCYRCGLRLKTLQDSITCEKCQNNPPHFDRLCALFSYDPPIRKMITKLKFSHQFSYGQVLGRLLNAQLPIWYKNEPLPQAVLPVPLHAKRLRQRGYNQVNELLRAVKKQAGLPILSTYCKRSRNTKPQSELTEKKRRSNVKNAFQILKPIPYDHVAILDDVITTGSTVNALSLALMNSGVENIDIWCICRA